MSDGLTPPPERLAVTVEVRPGEVRLVLEGELDLASAKELEGQLTAAQADDPARLVLDLRRLAFIDSSGLRTIIQADAAARAGGTHFVLVPGGESVQRVFDLTGAVSVLNFEAATDA